MASYSQARTAAARMMALPGSFPAYPRMGHHPTVNVKEKSAKAKSGKREGLDPSKQEKKSVSIHMVFDPRCPH
jgi:hypothetical protein